MPQLYTAAENSSLSLACEIDSVPGVFSVRWFKDGAELFINRTSLKDKDISVQPDYQITTNETTSVLKVFKITSDDHKSKFTCAVNSTVYPSSNSKVVVLKSETTSKLNVICKYLSGVRFKILEQSIIVNMPHK